MQWSHTDNKKILKNVMGSATEAEIGATYDNTQ